MVSLKLFYLIRLTRLVLCGLLYDNVKQHANDLKVKVMLRYMVLIFNFDCNRWFLYKY